MRYIIKGGVWKNSQDEILKAAIMKYGLNQWSRISSLLQRKSAKQCKQRWYEWLDPSIKKTQWSRIQDQKLLQLARVFPSQWRTIAPFVGRTPTQCFERYQKLLDLAQGKIGTQTQDLKRLRPGQIDPNPQTKPARLDPIDMDQDEKQMLAQVRVRLANTKGKKAKRKQRQKIIQQARRLAQLQKIRQLEMAGVDNIPTQKQIKRMRQKQDIDYNKQIPFKRQVPEFVYKIQQSQTSKNTFFASTISLQTLQGKRRDVQQQLQRKLDKKRLKKLKDSDYKAMMLLKNKFDKPISIQIQLPQPQLSQKDLQDIKKYNIITPLNSIIQNNSLIHMTPSNKIMLSAKINFSLNHQHNIMTPIIQQSNNDMDGINGLNYLKQIQKKQKQSNQNKSINRIHTQRQKTPIFTNQWEQDKSKIKNLFKHLRKPQNVLQFEIPQQQQQQQKQNQQQIIDAEQRQQMQAQQIKKNDQIKLSLRNQSLKLELDRVKNIPNKFTPFASNNIIQQLIEKQMLNMLYSDAIDYPIQQLTLPEQNTFNQITSLSLQKKSEIQKIIEQQSKQIQKTDKDYSQQYQASKKYMNHDMKTKTVRISQKILSDEQHHKQNMTKQFLNIQYYVTMILPQKQLAKTMESKQKKQKKYLGGYQKLISIKIQQINNMLQQLKNIKMEKYTFQFLYLHQIQSAKIRLDYQEQYYQIIYNSI